MKLNRYQRRSKTNEHFPKFNYNHPMTIMSTKETTCFEPFEQQQTEIESLRSQIEKAKEYEGTQGKENLYVERELAANIYNNISLFVSKYKLLLNANELLIKENQNLKNLISQKEEVISQFEGMAHDFQIKFQQLEVFNETQLEKIKTKYTKEINDLIAEVENCHQMIREKNDLINSFNRKILSVGNDKEMLLQKINDIRYQNENEKCYLNERLTALEGQNEKLKNEIDGLIKTNNQLKQYADTIEYSCALQAQKRNGYYEPSYEGMK